MSLLKITVAVPWSDPNATPCADIERYVNILRTQGYRTTAIRMCAFTFKDMCETQECRLRMRVVLASSNHPQEIGMKTLYVCSKLMSHILGFDVLMNAEIAKGSVIFDTVPQAVMTVG